MKGVAINQRFVSGTNLKDIPWSEMTHLTMQLVRVLSDNGQGLQTAIFVEPHRIMETAVVKIGNEAPEHIKIDQLEIL